MMIRRLLNTETGKFVAVDRQTSMTTDVAEKTAAKTSLQQAAAKVAERLLPKLYK